MVLFIHIKLHSCGKFDKSHVVQLALRYDTALPLIIHTVVPGTATTIGPLCYSYSSKHPAFIRYGHVQTSGFD